MACSDNVVRAGLTPKFIDVETLFEIANYDDTVMEKGRVVPRAIPGVPGALRLFEVPTPEFAVCQWEIPAGVSEAAFPAEKIGCAGRIKVAVFLSGVGARLSVVRGSMSHDDVRDLEIKFKGFAVYLNEEESFVVSTEKVPEEGGATEVYVVFPAEDHVKQPKLVD